MANLLFLALSLLHSEKPLRTSDISSSMFFPPSEGGEDEIESEDDGILYLGQMEPIPIWKANQYKEEDLIVLALCTKKVLCDPYSDEDPVTTAEFFMKSVCEAANKELDLSSYRKEFVEQKFSTADGKIQFHLILVDEDDLRSGIRDSVTAIRNWNKTEERGRFWVDVHGGFRSTMTVLSGIINLLKIDGIVPDKVYSPRFDNKERKMTLPRSGNEVSGKIANEIEIFDFVSGMDDFINYGNADLLIEFFGRHKASENEEKILEAIKQVAIGTQYCDSESYKSGLKALSKLLPKDDDKNRPQKDDNSLLGLFGDYIRDSYGDLLTGDRTTLMIVKRCVEKKLYQQALTFIEASMPDEIVKKGLLTFDISNYQLQEVRDNARDSGTNYYLFDAYLKMGGLYPTKKEKKSDKKDKESLKVIVGKCVKREEELRKVLNGARPGNLPMDTYVNTGEKNNNLPFDKKAEYLYRDLPGEIKGINSKLPAEDLDALGIYLRLHQLLKRCRNAFNHGLKDRPELTDLLKLLDLYIAYGEYLYRKCS